MNEPERWHMADEKLTIVPKEKTDFIHKISGTHADNAALYHAPVYGNFALQCKAHLTPAGLYDAAALLVLAGENQWAKLCIEHNNEGGNSIVSVITNPWSDDANGELLSHPTCWLRISRNGHFFGMHYSLDGTRWRFVRDFGAHWPETLSVGLAAQAPLKPGCTAVFEEVFISHDPVINHRSGN